MNVYILHYAAKWPLQFEVAESLKYCFFKTIGNLIMT